MRRYMLLLCVGVAVAVVGGASWWKTRPYPRWQLHAGLPLYARHERDCMYTCLKQYCSTCTIINFDAMSKKCWISTLQIPLLKLGNPVHDTILRYKGPPVQAALVMENYGMTTPIYSFTYAQAQDTCAELDGHLLNDTNVLDNLLALEIYTYHLCLCGWMEGGSQVLGSPGGNSSACGVTPGVNPCNETLAHAWCTLP